MVDAHQLLRHLADGRFHSGEALAARFQVTRAAIWKQLQSLPPEFGLQVHAVRGRGYRLAQALELLDPVVLSAALQRPEADAVERLWVLPSVDSTNSFLLRKAPPSIGRGALCLAEYQNAGRGRRGRRWASGFGTNLVLSLAWSFDLPLSALSGLSLAAGVAVAEVLDQFGLREHRLKWPNDVLVDGRKLAGILVEAQGEAQGPATAVIGIGLNMTVSTAQAAEIDQAWVDLSGAGLSGVSRNALAVSCTKSLIEACRVYAQRGLDAFLPRWRAYDGLLDREVRLVSSGKDVFGRYLGVDGQGALLLEHAGRRRAFHGGEVSLRERSDTD